jgi:hypothetical protein
MVKRLMTVMRKIPALLLLPVFVTSLLLITGTPAKAQQIDIQNFTSPSGNIHCLIVRDENESSADFSVQTAAWKKLAPKPADCDLDWDPSEIVLIVERAKTTVIEGGCRGDIGPYCPPGCRKLAYGSSVMVGKVRCTSQQDGIRCQATTGKKKGFLIGARSWKRL